MPVAVSRSGGASGPISCFVKLWAKRLGWLVVLFPVFTLFLASWRPASYLASASLEWQDPGGALPRGDAEAIVVVAGGDAEARYRHAAWLYTHWRAVPVLACVGRTRPEAGELSCSLLARRVLLRNGVPASMIWIESGSSNTYEDAVHATEALRRKQVRRIALVTEAIHMPRAEKCFRKQGLDVVAAPCRYRAAGLAGSWSELLPRRKYFIETRQAVHEWIGLVWYMVNGYV